MDALNLNIPAEATLETNWRLTRLSKRRYFEPLAPDRANGQGRPGYATIDPRGRVHLDSDVYAVQVDRVVSITPLSLDLTVSSREFYPLWSSLISREALASTALVEVG